MSVPSRRAGVALLMAGAVLAGCGGDSKTSAADYVHAVCGAVKSFETTVQTQSKQLKSVVQRSTATRTTLKTATARFLGQEVGDSTTAATAVSDAGTPDVSDGDQVRTTLVAAFRRLSSGYRADQRRVQRLDTRNASTFARQLTAVGDDSQHRAQSIGASLQGKQGLGGAQLNRASQHDTTCRALTGS